VDGQYEELGSAVLLQSYADFGGSAHNLNRAH
jgi:hypothetical protein